MYDLSTGPSATLVTVGVSATQLVGSNPYRVALILSAPPTNRYNWSFRQDVALDTGQGMYPADPPLILRRRDLGSAICLPLYAISAIGAQTIEVTEIVASP